MGFRISYIAAPITAEELAEAMGLTLDRVSAEMPASEWWVARLKTGYSILWCEDELFGMDNEDALESLSKRVEVLYCIVNETVMAATAMAYSDGHEIWSIHWQGDEGPKPENLTVSGEVPDNFDEELRRQAENQKTDSQVDHYFEIPLNVAASKCGFRHDMWLEPDQVDAFQVISKSKSSPSKPGFFRKLFGGTP